MMELLEQLLSTDNGVLVALVAFAWRYLAGERRRDIERRIKEAVRAAWLAASAITGRTSAELYTEARERARALLARLGIKADSEVGRLVEHELTMLAIEHDFATLPKLDAAGVDARMAEAEARGRARVAGIAEYVERVEAGP